MSVQPVKMQSAGFYVAPAGGRRSTRSRELSPLTWRIISFAVFFGLWEIAGRIPVSLAFPPFTEVIQALIGLMLSGELFLAYYRTLPPLLIGLVIIVVSGIGLGVGMGLSRATEWVCYPVLVVMQTAPMAALIPLVTFLYGIGIASKVMAVVILGMPMVALNSYNGIRNTSTSLLEMTRSFMGTRRQQVTKIILPSASGMIFAGLRLGISGAFIGIVLAELLITPTGIGDIISYYRSVARYEEMFAAIFSIIFLATVVLTGVQRLEARLYARIG